jgi:hypothetical protein
LPVAFLVLGVDNQIQRLHFASMISFLSPDIAISWPTTASGQEFRKSAFLDKEPSIDSTV